MSLAVVFCFRHLSIITCLNPFSWQIRVPVSGLSAEDTASQALVLFQALVPSDPLDTFRNHIMGS